jgi:hypothetical protein
MPQEMGQSGLPLVFRCKIGDVQPLTLPNAEPRFDVMHSRARPGREVHANARMLGKPRTDLLPMRGTDVVAHAMNPRDVRIHLTV